MSRRHKKKVRKRQGSWFRLVNHPQSVKVELQWTSRKEKETHLTKNHSILRFPLLVCKMTKESSGNQEVGKSCFLRIGGFDINFHSP